MYNTFELAWKYGRYLLKAENGKGHGIHSPFVFDFVTLVLNDSREFPCFRGIESRRRALLRDATPIDVEDLGAGSGRLSLRRRRVKDIARSSLKNKKFARLLYRIISFYHPEHLLELGTSLGITTAYLACAAGKGTVHTLEGAPEIAAIARKTFESLAFRNIIQVPGNFDDSLPAVLSGLNRLDFAFIDGNHREEPTLRYFEAILSGMHNDSVIIVDDVHWSAEMENAWKSIREHPAVTLTIDLFFIGVVFFKKEFLVKQHFSIRY